MNCAVYSSKTYSAGMLATVLGFAAVFAYAFRQMGHPPFYVIGLTALILGVAVTALIHSLVSRQPVVQVDAAGIVYHPRWFPLIEWPDIVAVVRKPLTERTSDGTHSYLKDDWRPIQIVVRDPEKYLQRVPSLLRMGLYSPEHPGCARIEITFMGMEPGSGVVEECIRHHLTQNGAMPSPGAQTGSSWRSST